MFKSFSQNANDLELIDIEQYTIFRNNNEFCIRIGKTKTKKYFVIQAQYEINDSIDSFQTKLTLNNLKEKSKYFSVASNVDEIYTIFKNLFEINEVIVKDIINKNYLKLVFNFQKKDLEINLLYRKNETNIFFQKKYPSIDEIDIEENLNINEIQHNEIIRDKKEDSEQKDKQNKEEEENGNNENFKEDNVEEDKNNLNEIKNEDKEIEKEDTKEDNNKNSIDNDNNANQNEKENENQIKKEITDNNNEIINNNENTEERDNDDKYKTNIEENNNCININETNNENSEREKVIIVNDGNINCNLLNTELNEKEEKIDDNKNIEKEQNKDKSEDSNNNFNINELLEKIKNLEEENKKLKEKVLEISFIEDKLKKSEKEKEKLKIELQQLKNSINVPSLNKKKSLNNKIQMEKPNNNENNIERQKTALFQSRLDIYQTNKNKNITQKKNIIKQEKKDVIQENYHQNNKDTTNIKSKPPINLKIYKTITQSSYIPCSIDNTFAAFSSLNNELLLVYATKMKSIECFDLVKNKFHKTILNAHNGEILTIRHYCPKIMNKDLILSGSNGDYAVKIWEVETWSCIFNISKIYEKGNMYSVCILFDEFQNENFIFTSSDADFIKIYDFDGKFIKNINKTNTNENYFIDTFYDRKDYKYYLISGEMRTVKSYELNTHQLFRIYCDNNSFCEHISAFIYRQDGITKLVESEFFGSIRVWDFHSGNLIKKIEICRRIPLVSMCLWNENYLLVSCVDNTIKLVDFKNYALIKSFAGHNNEVCTIKKIIHPSFEECLISQGLYNDQIKLWINE